MKLKQFRKIALGKPDASEDFPFGPGTLVLKVAGKMFALVGIDADPLYANLKCDPLMARAWREQYPEVTPGYHMNKDHWNSVLLEGSLSNALIAEMIGISYELVVSGLPKRERERLGRLPTSD
jgi:predicted DNA-binding protein (MmcQ/YjbR family)